MKSHKKAKGGFTLVELLVVVTLIAIVATIAISLMSGASKDASETVNIANIKQLTGNMGAYMQLHDGSLPNKLDSLMNATSVAAGGSYTPLVNGSSTTTVYVADVPGSLLYVGLDANRDGVIDDASGTSKGLDPAAWSGVFRSLTVSKLTASDITYLSSIGISTVYDITPAKDLFHGEFSYVERSLKAGDPVCVVDPTTARNGQGAYFDLGFHDLSNTTNYPRATGGDLSSDGRAAAMVAARFLVFGVGPNATLVGDRKAGLQEAPNCAIEKTGYYKRYLLVVKSATGPNDMTTDFAGILDPQGNTSRAAASWATRTGN